MVPLLLARDSVRPASVLVDRCDVRGPTSLGERFVILKIRGCDAAARHRPHRLLTSLAHVLLGHFLLLLQSFLLVVHLLLERARGGDVVHALQLDLAANVLQLVVVQGVLRVTADDAEASGA